MVLLKGFGNPNECKIPQQSPCIVSPPPGSKEELLQNGIIIISCGRRIEFRLRGIEECTRRSIVFYVEHLGEDLMNGRVVSLRAMKGLLGNRGNYWTVALFSSPWSGDRCFSCPVLSCFKRIRLQATM